LVLTAIEQRTQPRNLPCGPIVAFNQIQGKRSRWHFNRVAAKKRVIINQDWRATAGHNFVKIMRACCATNGIRKRNLFGRRKRKGSFVTDQVNASFGHCSLCAESDLSAIRKQYWPKAAICIKRILSFDRHFDNYCLKGQTV
jgi:hypothetical protein